MISYSNELKSKMQHLACREAGVAMGKMRYTTMTVKARGGK